MELTVKDLEFSYHCFPVLKGISFSFNKGELVCVLGKNGAGKSTLFRCLLGLLKGYQGEILIDGTERRHFSERDLAGRIAYIPQNHNTAFSFSVLDMVLMGTTASLPRFANPGKKEKDRAKILIMDEPCSSLDYGNQIRVMKELRSLSEKGYLIVQSTHNPEHVFHFAHKALVMMDGTIRALGKPDKILTKELLEGVYQVPIEIYEDLRSGKKVCMPGKGDEYVGNL